MTGRIHPIKVERGLNLQHLCEFVETFYLSVYHPIRPRLNLSLSLLLGMRFLWFGRWSPASERLRRNSLRLGAIPRG